MAIAPDVPGERGLCWEGKPVTSLALRSTAEAGAPGAFVFSSADPTPLPLGSVVADVSQGPPAPPGAAKPDDLLGSELGPSRARLGGEELFGAAPLASEGPVPGAGAVVAAYGDDPAAVPLPCVVAPFPLLVLVAE